MNNKQKIGTHFKKENIFLATVSATEKNAKIGLSEIYESLIAGEVDIGSVEMFDIFYKDEAGYLRFFLEGVERYVGDNSDGMGVLKNIMPVWNYFTEDELFESELADGSVVIGFTTQAPLSRYNLEQNFGYKHISELATCE